MSIDGFCHDRFAAVKSAFEHNFSSGEDVGASVCVIHDGEVVVDLWGGEADDINGVTRPWESDTLINVWSTTKTMAALCLLMLHDRGQLDVDAPVATYWPEFAANGKEGVLVRHVLSHTAGLSGWDTPLVPEDMHNPDKVAALLGAQAPWWEPGSASGYHAISQGFLEGEIVKRVTGRSIGSFFAEEVAAKVNADFHIGTSAEHDHRVVRVIPPSAPLNAEGLDMESIAIRTFINPMLDARASWVEGWRRAEIPAAGGHGNARSVARAQAVVSHGGEFNGVQLLSQDTLELIFREQCYGTDMVLGVPLRHGIGYGLMSPETPLSPNQRVCYWGGWGGSLIVNDMDSRMTFAYVMNRMGEGTVGDLRGGMLLFAAHAAVAAV